MADEAYIGGHVGNMNNKRRKTHEKENKGRIKATQGKTPIVTLINPETGQHAAKSATT